MRFSALVFAGFLAGANGQAVAPPGGCLVCGPGQVVGNPEAVFEFPGQPSVPCGVLQSAGTGGLIPVDQCGFLPTLLGECDCGPGELPAPETPAPVVPPTDPPVDPPTDPPVDPPTMPPVDPPTDVPVPAPTMPPVDPTPCSICGNGLVVTNEGAIFEFPGQPSVSCGDLQNAGAAGVIAPNNCIFLPGIVDVCECAPGELPPFTPVAPIAATPVEPVFLVPTGDDDDGDGGGDGAVGDGGGDGAVGDGGGDGAVGDGGGDGVVGDGGGDGAVGDGGGDGAMGDGGGDGAMGDGAVGDGGGDGAMGDGAVGDGVGDGAMGDGAAGDGTGDGAMGDGDDDDDGGTSKSKKSGKRQRHLQNKKPRRSLRPVRRGNNRN